jgi:hypothetical protein
MFQYFNEAEIFSIYQSFVIKNREYLSKYDILNEDTKEFLDKIFSHALYRWDARDYSRVRTILDFKEWIEKYQICPNYLAYTYVDDPELKLIKYNYFDKIEYYKGQGDLHQLNIIEKYDFFLFNQTLEHLYNPFIAVKNIYNSLINGGYVFTSVPTINIPHSTPIHYNGYNPMGLAMLFKSCGFNIIEIGQWGNYEYINKLFATHQWPGYKNLSPNGHKNEEKNVVSCWVLAQKLN